MCKNLKRETLEDKIKNLLYKKANGSFPDDIKTVKGDGMRAGVDISFTRSCYFTSLTPLIHNLTANETPPPPLFIFLHL